MTLTTTATATATASESTAIAGELMRLLYRAEHPPATDLLTAWLCRDTAYADLRHAVWRLATAGRPDVHPDMTREHVAREIHHQRERFDQLWRWLEPHARDAIALARHTTDHHDQ